MSSRGSWLACAMLAVAAHLSTASSTGSTTSLRLYSRQQDISSSRSSSSSSSSGASAAGAVRQLMAAQQRKCTQYATQVNTHFRNGYRLAVQKYRNAQQCPALCKAFDSSVPSGVFTVQCNIASCTCTATRVKDGAKAMLGLTDVGRFSFTALYPAECTADMSAKCAGLYEWCRNC
uniref:Pherophorin domain-containing protein n=1 Tax=Tetradesmus obliquus TaxID=3088 RepID=A0A383WJR9_TETOB|eukprot:jgi/Sobl393_1/6233/SZX76986.1